MTGTWRRDLLLVVLICLLVAAWHRDRNRPITLVLPLLIDGTGRVTPVLPPMRAEPGGGHV